MPASDQKYPLPACDPQMGMERLDGGWYVECLELFCGYEDGGCWLDYNQARRMRSAHRKLHQEGRATVGRTFRKAYEIRMLGCQCDWAGSECCHVHITEQDKRNWEATA